MPAHTLTDNAIRKLRRALSGRLGGSGGGAGGPATVAPILYPPPFTVRFAASLATAESSEGAGDGTDGEWIIYLPTTGLVKVGDANLDLSSDLTAAGGEYPSGWYILRDEDDEPILDLDQGGALYLVVELGDTPTAYFAAQAGSAAPSSFSIKICDALVNSTTGNRTVKQYVSSSLVVGAGEDHDTITTADEKSISRAYRMSGGVVDHFSNIVQIKGFGRFHPDAVQHPTEVRGTYEAATTLNIDPGSTSTVSFLVRSGNEDNVDGNALGYRKINIKNVLHPSPFQFVVEENVRKIVNNVFYFDGTERSLADFAGVPSDGMVYLVCTRTDPDYERAEPAVWSFAISTAAGVAGEGETVTNIKLFEFEDGDVKVDYRHAFLTIPANDFDMYYWKGAFKKLKLGSGSGTPTELGKIVAMQDVTITQKTLVAGSNITLTPSGDTITISATASGGGSSTSGYTTPSGSEDVTIAAMRYDVANHQLQVKYCRETYENGLLKTRAVDSAWSIIEGGQAVAETV